MRKNSTVLLIVLAAGAAAVAIAWQVSAPEAIAPPPATPASYFDETAAIEDRIRALEAAVSAERQARQLLEDELTVLYAGLERLEAGRGERNAMRRAAEEEMRVDRGAAMQAVGLPPGRAEWIMQRESELQFESMRAVYEARMSGKPLDGFDPRYNPDAMLRSEIGDAEYELYLNANGRSTSVNVASVMASSPAARAGLQAGDQIVAYNGQRIFNRSDLLQQTMAGGEGNVIVDVLRDGVTMQVVLPRGPIGIEMGRFRGSPRP